MTKKEFMEIASKIRAYYPESSIMETQDAISLWYERLKEIPYKVLDEAVNVWVLNNKWTPTISDLVEYSDKATKKIEFERIEKLSMGVHV